MILDRTKFDYLDSGIHQNILVQVTLGEKLGILSAPPTLERVALRLVKRNPKWKLFVEGRHIDSDGKRRVKKLWVYQGSEELGWVATGHNYTTNNPSITFDSPSLRVNRERKQYNETASEDTAVKVIEKNFFAKPLEQVLLGQYAETRNVILGVRSDKQQQLLAFERDINPSILRYAWDNIDTIRHALVDNYAATHDLINSTISMRQAVKVSPGPEAVNVITIIEGTYYVHPSGTGVENTPAASYTTDTLPSDIKGKLGMLKLVEAKNLVAGVGVRINENTYAVIKGGVE